MGTKLSILNDSHSSPNLDGWHDRTRPISSNEIINNIENPNAEVATNILTAVPSPLARYHIFDIAFQYLAEFLRKKKTIEKNNTFFKLVSEALDAFEVVFYFEYLKEAHDQLKIETISINDLIDNLNQTQRKEHVELASVLDKYFKSSPFNHVRHQSFIIKYNSEIVAITSPLTVWAVPEDKNFMIDSILGPKRQFFDNDNPVRLRDRDEEFIFYLYALKAFLQTDRFVYDNLKNFFNYLDEELHHLIDATLISKIRTITENDFAQYSELRTNNAVNVKLFNQNQRVKVKSAIRMKNLINSSREIAYTQGTEFPAVPLVLKDGIDPITGKQDNSKYDFFDSRPFSERTIPGRSILYPTLCPGDFFETNLIMLDYPIGQDFEKPNGFPNNADYSFLLPIKPLYFKFFTKEDLANNLSFTGDKEDCKFEVKIPIQSGGYVTLQRRYTKISSGDQNAGRIEKLSFGMAFFPLIRYINPIYNNYYSVMLVDGEYNDTIRRSSDIKLDFIVKNGLKFNLIEGNRVEKGIRYKKDTMRGVTFYELNAEFDFVRVNYDGFGIEMSGMIIPKWSMKGTNNDPGYNIAIDFGTTNTTLALKVSDGPTTLEFSESDKIVVTLNHQEMKSLAARSFEELIEQRGSLREMNFRHTLYSYMLPLRVTLGGLISFPIRSAIYEGTNCSKPETGLFKFRNTHFAFYKTTKLNSDEYFTNLKWEKSSNVLNNVRVKDFMRELLILARSKVISAGGDPSKSELITFKPSSLSSGMARTIAAEWQSVFSEVFSTRNNPFQITESQAPAFYLWKNSNAQGGRMFGDHSTLIIDIGGGSTDIAVFRKNQLQMQTSLKFAGNDLYSCELSKYFWDIFATHGQTMSDSNYQNVIGNSFFGTRPNPVFFQKNGYELFNYIFSADENLARIGSDNIFANVLKSNDAFKFSILYFYAAIQYHVFEILKIKNYDIANVRFINMTGKGSNVVRLLETLVGARPKGLERFTRELIKSLYGSTVNPIEVHLVENSKEITAWGGLEWLDSQSTKTDQQDFSPIYYLGTGTSDHIYEATKTLEIKKFIDHKQDIIKNVLEFHERFFDVISIKMNIKQEFDIDCIRSAMNWKLAVTPAKMSDLFDIMYDALDGQYDAEVNHSIFFEPIKILIDDLFLSLSSGN